MPKPAVTIELSRNATSLEHVVGNEARTTMKRPALFLVERWRTSVAQTAATAEVPKPAVTIELSRNATRLEHVVGDEGRTTATRPALLLIELKDAGGATRGDG